MMEANIINNPKMPVIDNPIPRQQAALDGYKRALLKNVEMIALLQKYEPMWLPKFELTPLAVD